MKSKKKKYLVKDPDTKETRIAVGTDGSRTVKDSKGRRYGKKKATKLD